MILTFGKIYDIMTILLFERKRKMKKIIALLLILAMTLTFFGCKSENAGVVDEGNTVVDENPTVADVEVPTNAPETEAPTEPATEPKTEPVTEPKTEPKTEPATQAKPTCEHDYQAGVCTKCGEEHRDAAGIRDALKKCERYVKYLEIDADILETQVERYKLTKDASILVEIQEKVIEIDGYYAKIRQYCEPYKKTYLYGLYNECDREMPIVQSGSLSKVSTYARHAGYIKDFYASSCANWGV